MTQALVKREPIPWRLKQHRALHKRFRSSTATQPVTAEPQGQQTCLDQADAAEFNFATLREGIDPSVAVVVDSVARFSGIRVDRGVSIVAVCAVAYVTRRWLIGIALITRITESVAIRVSIPQITSR